MNDTIAGILNHRSIRKYRPETVPEDDIRQAVQAGQMASTSSAVQSYCVLQIKNQEQRETLAELTGSQEQVAQSGAFFIICGDTRRHRLINEREGIPYAARLEAFLLAVIDASLFAQNMVLAFESMGYGVCYIGGLRNDLPAVDRLLNNPEGVYPLYGLCVGVPDEQPLARPRLNPEAVWFENHYPDDEAMLGMIDAYDTTYQTYLKERGANPRKWSGAMARKFSEPRRSYLAAYYQSKGADLS